MDGFFCFHAHLFSSSGNGDGVNAADWRGARWCKNVKILSKQGLAE
ncbi:hypothetical protein [Burkholderia ambifaria]|nr:hypothetical protein [Burkholderia ambifaria]